MKRIFFFFILAALLCGCVPADNKGQDSVTDSIGVVSNDTIDLKVPEDPVPEPAPESEPEPPFTSLDLRWKQLQGHVKQLKQIEKNGYAVYNFDRQGNFISYDDSYSDAPYRIERNKNGQIVGWCQWEEENETNNYGEEYCYNSDGYICKMNSGDYDEEDKSCEYVLNDRGWPISAKCEMWCAGNESPYKDKVSYSYSNIDTHGNWLKVKVITTGQFENTSYSYASTITRKITYWQ